MTTERLIYLPLGGAGEIGMNAYVYGYGRPGKERLIVVDLGVTFPDMDTSPGVDLIFPDISWLEKRRDRIDGIFITHGHEDHVGAVGHLWDRLRAPIHTRAFTGSLARRKLDEHGAPDTALNIHGAYPVFVEAGPFRVAFVPISHSIPESAGLAIDTPAGRILHTGDFKIDETPIVGEAFDRKLWAEVAKDGVKALVCDSTNVFSPKPGRSEASIADNLERLIRSAPGMIAATTFASNVARLKTLATAADRAGRRVCLLGRSMQRMVQTAKEEGLLKGFPETVPPEDAAGMPREKLLLLVTGSQGERRAASAQLAGNAAFLGMSLKDGDTFLFSSRVIPGNERGVIRIMNQLSEKGVDVVEDLDGEYHVSGHANRPDLLEMHEITKPQVVIPMHGEHRHLREHAKLAEAAGRTSMVVVNGMMIDLSGNAPKVAEYVETGRTYLDGSVQVGALDGVVRDRIRMSLNGHLLVTVILDENDDLLGDPWVETMGLPETGSSGTALAEVVEADLAQFTARAAKKTLRSETILDKELKKIARQSAFAEIGKKPEVTVVVSRLS